MSKNTQNSRFNCLMEWLVSRGKAKLTARGYEIVKTKKQLIKEEIE